MKYSIHDKVVQALQAAKQYNSSIMVKPEVILWPDPEAQWLPIITELQKSIPALLLFGEYDTTKNSGPAIWLKCMVAKKLPEASWDDTTIPVIYLPGISKNIVRNIQQAGFLLQPLIEYQFTGTFFTQENGKEWTILAFLQNTTNGLGVKVAQDTATKEALKKALSSIVHDQEVLYGKMLIDAAYLNNLLVPDIIPNILKWISKGDAALETMESGKKEIFINLCKTGYEFEPDTKNIIAIVEKLGTQRKNWKYVWQHYAAAPKKYPEIPALLRLAKPVDLGSGMFALPQESWPQVNEAGEDALRQTLAGLKKLTLSDAIEALKKADIVHSCRRQWVWAELGQAPLANALQYLVQMAETTAAVYPSSSVADLQQYYTATGYLADQAMRKSLAAVKFEQDKGAVISIITSIYKPWLQSITQKFQQLIAQDASVFTNQAAFIETETFILFVDAFRYELAVEFTNHLRELNFTVDIQTSWSALPSLTPTAKPGVSPITNAISSVSQMDEFRPRLNSGKDLSTAVFRESLAAHNYIFVIKGTDIVPGSKHWQETGNIDTKGHEEGAEMVKRVQELFEHVQEIIETAFKNGITKIKVVTDHGWLLLPGGLPKEVLHKDLTETRWGRCAFIKEGAKTSLLHLPWRWNPAIFIAYAPGISFFKVNEEYAHGGISLHECLVPQLIIQNTNTTFTNATIKAVKWVNLKCIVTTEEAPDGYMVDIRTKYNDPLSSIVLSPNKLLNTNRISLMVDDTAEGQAATIVLADENGRILDRKLTTVGD